MLTDAVRYLVCPVCAAGLAAVPGALRCPAGHAFDIARQGYVNLLPGNARPGTADTPQMAAARQEFLAAGHFASLGGRLADRVAGRLAGAGGAADAGSLVVDAGAGTGYHLAAALEKLPGAAGLALDVSKHALRRAARAHPRIAAAVVDLWRPWPVCTGAATAILNVFAPRNGAEFHRVLRPGGRLYVVTPTAGHLGSLVNTLGLLSVDEHKAARVAEALAGRFTLDSRETCAHEAVLTHHEIEILVAMGPSAWHVPAAELRARLKRIPDPVAVPLSCTLSVYRRTAGKMGKESRTTDEKQVR